MDNNRIWILLTRKLSGEASHTELKELDDLIEQYPQYAKTVTSVTDCWGLNNAIDPEFLEATYLQHLERMKSKGVTLSQAETVLKERNEYSKNSENSFSFKNLSALLGFIVLLVALNVIVKKPSPALETAEVNEIGHIVTVKGSRTKTQLPDGSNVWLNAGSTLNYKKRFDSGLREVYLSGEAFFDVVKKPDQPFVIHTSRMDVKVLGTQFNVRAYELDKTFETSLINGSVEVFLQNDPAKKYLLKANQKLVLTNSFSAKLGNNTQKPVKELPHVQIKELAYVKGTDIAIESSWTKNILSFEDEAFIDVAIKMERWYDVEFDFKNKKWEQQFLSGSFERESLEQAMAALKFSTGFSFNIEGKKIVIY